MGKPQDVLLLVRQLEILRRFSGRPYYYGHSLDSLTSDMIDARVGMLSKRILLREHLDSGQFLRNPGLSKDLLHPAQRPQCELFISISGRHSQGGTEIPNHMAYSEAGTVNWLSFSSESSS